MQTDTPLSIEEVVHLRNHAEFKAFDSREDWLAARRTEGIGSSDAAAILGLSRFKSALGLYYDKIGMGEEHPRAQEAAAWGLALEEPIARRYAAITGRHVAAPTPHSFATSKQYPFAIASVDRFIVGRAEPVEGVAVRDGLGILEVKNAHYFMADQWSEENNNEPPVEYQVQVQHQLMVTGLPWGSIAALIGGSYFVWADIPRDEELIGMLAEKEREFWARVLERVPPEADGSESSREILKKLYPKDTGEIVTLGPEAIELHEQLEAAKLAEKTATLNKETAANQLRQLIGDASMATLPNGVSYTYKLQRQAESIRKATEFRVLRVQKGKK